MQRALLCGQGSVVVDLPERVRPLEMKPLQALPDPEAAVRRALEDPIDSAPLRDLARKSRDACVVISDVTRPVPNRVILPPLLNTLEEAGIAKERILLLVATGMHRPNLGEELASMVGKEILERYRIVNHLCREASQMRRVDEIDGAPIEVNRHYLDAQLKILTGLIEPHFYAGFSGGRKSILPGIASFETMKFMHSYRMIDHPAVTNCRLAGNPFHEYGVRIAERVGVDFIVNVVINRAREIAGVFAGHYDRAHLAGCRMVETHALVTVEQPVDLVVTSGGGYPLDATFYQISKALIGARDILKPGGSIVVACECREGLGSPEFCGILRSVCTPEEFFKGYCDPREFVIDQWCAQNIFQVLEYAGKVYAYAPGLAQEDLGRLGIHKVEDLAAILRDLLPRHPEAVVIPDGPYVVGRLP